MKVLGNVTGTPYGKKDFEQYADDNFRPNTWTPSADEVGARPNTWTPTAEEVGAVEANRLLFYIGNDNSIAEAIESMAGMAIRIGYSWSPLSDYPIQAEGRWSIVIYNLDYGFTEITATLADGNNQSLRRWIGKYTRGNGNGIRWTRVDVGAISGGPYEGDLNTVGENGVKMNTVVWVTPNTVNVPIRQYGWVETLHSHDNAIMQRYTSLHGEVYVRCRWHDGNRDDWHQPWKRVDSGSILDAVYPVNSIYISYSHTSPASLFGGTWTRISSAFLWATASDGIPGNTGGEYAVTLTEENLPNLHGALQFRAISGGANNASVKDKGNVFTYTENGGDIWGSATGKVEGDQATDLITFNVGSGAAHNNIPPYVEVSVWRRIA